jgi:hypothetical protein
VTDNLVERLREEVNDHMFGIIQSPLQLEAADLIESQFKLLERSGEVLALLYYRIEQLERLLEQRDSFIVKNDLWHDFVATLGEKKDA